MNCKHAFTHTTLVESFGQAFVCTDLRNHRATVWYAVEEARFPETLPWVQLYRMFEDYKAKRCDRELDVVAASAAKYLYRLANADAEYARLLAPVAARICGGAAAGGAAAGGTAGAAAGGAAAAGNGVSVARQLQEHAYSNRAHRALAQLNDDYIARARPLIRQLVAVAQPGAQVTAIRTRVINDLRLPGRLVWEATAVHRPATGAAANAAGAERVAAPQYHGRCAAENCTGLLDETRACVTCRRTTCTDCRCCISPPSTAVAAAERPAESQHVCDPDTVASVRAVQRLAKPCPGCGTAIDRVSGCFLMWCVLCHTSFDWNTLERVETANNHNPHFVEYMTRMRENNDTGGIGLCRVGRDALYTAVGDKMRTSGGHALNEKQRRDAVDMLRELYHFRDDWQTIARSNDTEKMLLDARIQFLLTGDDKKFKTALVHAHKMTEANVERLGMVEIVVESVEAVVYMFTRRESTSKFADVSEQLKRLAEIHTEQTKKFTKIFKMRAPVVKHVPATGVLNFE
jgi:hypothetical protein